MYEDLNLVELVRLMAKTDDELYCKLCTVDKVYEDSRTADCSPVDKDAPILHARLQASKTAKDGFVMFPVVGSQVVVAFFNKNTGLVVLAESVYKSMLKIGDTEIVVNAQETEEGQSSEGNSPAQGITVMSGGNEIHIGGEDKNITVTAGEGGISINGGKRGIRINGGDDGVIFNEGKDGMVLYSKLNDYLKDLEMAILQALVPIDTKEGAAKTAFSTAIAKWSTKSKMQDKKLKH